MGLFDFMKSPEQKKKDDLMKKLSDEIFPNGQVQIEKEVQEVRELFGFKYTREAVKETYVHASAIYYLSKEKNVNDFLSSILRNPKSSVTKDDAYKLYEYLQTKFVSKAVKEAVQKISNHSDSYKLFLIAKGGIVELKNAYKDLSNAGKFEVILLNSMLLLMDYQEMFPQKYATTLEEYFTLLLKQAADYGISIPPERLRNFINSRFEFYFNELSEQAENNLYLQTRTFSNFYEQPLLDEPESSEDLGEYVLFLSAYWQMISWVRHHTDILKK